MSVSETECPQPEEMRIEMDKVSKVFTIRSENRKTLKDIFVYHDKKKAEKRTVLDDISFRVRKGEALGIIGKNGSGKSTILKLLTGILSPDSGEIRIDGKISSLLELGAGFHPDMTGRENIYINASIYGFSKKEIDGKIDEIIEYSELGKFIDDPIRIYSSGMYMRLAFAVSINVDADVILVDEILAVGDEAFRKKCLDTLRDMKMKGATIVLVSHSMGQVRSMCDRAIWMEDGKIKEIGECEEICNNYLKSVSK